MRTPTDFEIQRLLAHAYDPVKAHEYYIKNRKLKGRKAGLQKTANSRLVKSLAYVQEGGDSKVAAQLVKWAQGKSDEEIKKKIVEIKKKYGNRDATMSFSLNQILKNRERIRSNKGSSTAKAKTLGSKTKTEQKKKLKVQIQGMENKLKKLEALIQKKIHEEALDNRKAKAKKERAAKEADKPKTAAEKAQIARDNEKYRAKNQQALKTADKQSSKKSSESSSPNKSQTTGSTVTASDLKSLASKVRGQIAVAKQKLAAL